MVAANLIDVPPDPREDRDRAALVAYRAEERERIDRKFVRSRFQIEMERYDLPQLGDHIRPVLPIGVK